MYLILSPLITEACFFGGGGGGGGWQVQTLLVQGLIHFQIWKLLFKGTMHSLH